MDECRWAGVGEGGSRLQTLIQITSKISRKSGERGDGNGGRRRRILPDKSLPFCHEKNDSVLKKSTFLQKEKPFLLLKFLPASWGKRRRRRAFFFLAGSSGITFSHWVPASNWEGRWEREPTLRTNRESWKEVRCEEGCEEGCHLVVHSDILDNFFTPKTGSIRS